jgi:hypothetical protein
MDYWISYSIIISYYILGFLYFLFITKKKTSVKYENNYVRDDLTHDLLMEDAF